MDEDRFEERVVNYARAATSPVCFLPRNDLLQRVEERPHFVGDVLGGVRVELFGRGIPC
jgi:hypothetical protein